MCHIEVIEFDYSELIKKRYLMGRQGFEVLINQLVERDGEEEPEVICLHYGFPEAAYAAGKRTKQEVEEWRCKHSATITYDEPVFIDGFLWQRADPTVAVEYHSRPLLVTNASGEFDGRFIRKFQDSFWNDLLEDVADKDCCLIEMAMPKIKQFGNDPVVEDCAVYIIHEKMYASGQGK